MILAPVKALIVEAHPRTSEPVTMCAHVKAATVIIRLLQSQAKHQYSPNSTPWDEKNSVNSLTSGSIPTLNNLKIRNCTVRVHLHFRSHDGEESDLNSSTKDEFSANAG